MRMRLCQLCCVLVLVSTVYAGQAEAQRRNVKIAPEDMLPDFDSTEPLVERAAAVVRLKIAGSQMREFKGPGRIPTALMEHTADVLEVFKGDVVGRKRLVFYQRAGRMDVGEYRIQYDVDPDSIPQKGEELVVFLQWNKGLQNFELLSQRQGLYRLDAENVVPSGDGKLARRYRGVQREVFLNTLKGASK